MLHVRNVAKLNDNSPVSVSFSVCSFLGSTKDHEIRKWLTDPRIINANSHSIKWYKRFILIWKITLIANQSNSDLYDTLKEINSDVTAMKVTTQYFNLLLTSLINIWRNPYCIFDPSLVLLRLFKKDQPPPPRKTICNSNIITCTENNSTWPLTSLAYESTLIYLTQVQLLSDFIFSKEIRITKT